MTNRFFYRLVPSAFGSLALVWRESAEENGTLSSKVQRVLLPRENVPAEGVLQTTYGGIQAGSCPPIAELGERMQRFLAGEAARFVLDGVALENCSSFQRRVLLAEYRIPRGWVSTYGRIAQHLGVSGGARAVGRALATNPFPILIPCHRAIRANGELGGFQGGLPMKRALLELEGIEFSARGRVVATRVYYEYGAGVRCGTNRLVS